MDRNIAVGGKYNIVAGDKYRCRKDDLFAEYGHGYGHTGDDSSEVVKIRDSKGLMVKVTKAEVSTIYFKPVVEHDGDGPQPVVQSYRLDRVIFEESFFEDVVEGCFGFGVAIEKLKAGKKVSRSGWNGKNMYLELQVPDVHSKMTLPYIYMATAQGDLVPWLASQTDMLSNDWEESER